MERIQERREKAYLENLKVQEEKQNNPDFVNMTHIGYNNPDYRYNEELN